MRVVHIRHVRGGDELLLLSGFFIVLVSWVVSRSHVLDAHKKIRITRRGSHTRFKAFEQPKKIELSMPVEEPQHGVPDEELAHVQQEEVRSSLHA